MTARTGRGWDWIFALVVGLMVAGELAAKGRGR